ncbi:MAG: PAS domain-containing protein, partial [Desulfatitalea sp.]|nr:PAS domain-containing protein [Desulfatitalea sp.]
VNSRFEELFRIKNEEIQGKSDYDIFPKEVADQFHASDLQVLLEGRPHQVEESIPQEDGDHTYLLVKFPVYDDQGVANGLCGIATDITELKKAQYQLRRLSGSIMAGQEKERTAIARAIVNQPPVLLADEPTGNLDTRNARVVMELFGRLHQSGTTIIMVTHSTGCAQYAQRVLQVSDGRLSGQESIRLAAHAMHAN